MNPTSRDIAERAGVSHVTVSRVLRNLPGVSPTTRDRVLRIAEAAGYRQHPMLQAWMAHVQGSKVKSYQATLVWLNTNIRQNEWHFRPYRRLYFEGAQRRCRELGFALDEIWIKAPGMNADRLAQILRTRSIHGIIIPQDIHVDFLPGMDWNDFAVATIGQPPYSIGWHCVDPDNFKNMALVMRQLMELGYQRIGLAVLENHHMWADPWIACYLAGQLKLPRSKHLPIFFHADPYEAHASDYKAWLHKHRPEVVINCDFRIKALTEAAGFSVPEDVGLVHMHVCDDVADWAGIDQRDEEIGATSVSLLTACLFRNERGPVPIPRRSLVPGEWKAGTTLRKLC